MWLSGRPRRMLHLLDDHRVAAEPNGARFGSGPPAAGPFIEQGLKNDVLGDHRRLDVHRPGANGIQQGPQLFLVHIRSS